MHWGPVYRYEHVYHSPIIDESLRYSVNPYGDYVDASLWRACTVRHRWFHRYHHFYKSPQPFDDLFIHPLEVTRYPPMINRTRRASIHPSLPTPLPQNQSNILYPPAVFPKAFWYYCILYGPAFWAGPMPLESFALYMALMGVCGVLDHRRVCWGVK